MATFLERLRAKTRVETRVHERSDFLSREEVSEILKTIEGLSYTETIVGIGPRRRIASVVRDTLGAPLRKSPAVEWFFDRVVSELERSFSTTVLTPNASFNSLKYTEGSHYVSHNDGMSIEVREDSVIATRIPEYDRDLSVIVYLNGEFTGGDLVFQHTGRIIRPRAGTLIAFPSDWRHEHKVNPVESGTRYALVNWYKATPSLVRETEVIPEAAGAAFYRGV